MTTCYWILNGPNLNLLGQRETDIYGSLSFADLEAMCRKEAESLGVTLEWRQSNHEGELVDWVQEAAHAKGATLSHGMLINAGAYTHSSIALHDALRLYERPAIEIHLSNVYKRESFRHHSYLSAVVDGVICGLGADVYRLGLQALKTLGD